MAQEPKQGKPDRGSADDKSPKPEVTPPARRPLKEIMRLKSITGSGAPQDG